MPMTLMSDQFSSFRSNELLGARERSELERAPRSSRAERGGSVARVELVIRGQHREESLLSCSGACRSGRAGRDIQRALFRMRGCASSDWQRGHVRASPDARSHGCARPRGMRQTGMLLHTVEPMVACG